MDLRAALQAARSVEGCPHGADEDLLALASPPLYTPFPNPFVEEFLSSASSARRQSAASVAPPSDHPYFREPIALDISEGRTDPAYLAQSYHTKVPYRAIARYIEHFTDPGDLVLDGFCGSGMTGVAANQLHRRAILCDLSPAATFLAHSYCHPVDLAEAEGAIKELLFRLEQECGWLYQVAGTGLQGKQLTLFPGWWPSAGNRREDRFLTIDYVIWSELFICPRCQAEFPFSEAGFDFERRRPLRVVRCPSCGCELHPGALERSLDAHGRTKQVPARVAYVGCKRPRELFPGPDFLELQEEIESESIPHWYPDNPMMNQPTSRSTGPDCGVLNVGGGWGDMWRRGYHSGIERVSDFYFKRTLWVLSTAVHLAATSGCSLQTRQLLLQVIVNLSTSLTKMRRAYQGVLPLVLYVPKLQREVNVIRALAARFRVVTRCLAQLRTSNDVLITTQSTTSLPNIPDGCVDYVFTDPPFGDNIRYSEVNFLWEAWLRAFTNRGPEAIISPGQAKGLAEYQELMWRCFAEIHRLLKPGRWISVAFHSSESRVWNAIQQAMRDAGFEVADVRLLDKCQMSFKQASAKTVRHDLVISARKLSGTRSRGESLREAAHEDERVTGQDGPKSAPSRSPALSSRLHQSGAVGDPETAWEFVRRRLSELPVPAPGDRTSREALERQGLELFNRMVADHVQRRIPVPLDAQQFFSGLRDRFEERDGIYLLPQQAREYDRLVASSNVKI